MHSFIVDLYYYYYEAPRSSRKFLLSTHYRVALEIESKGSIQLHWCSLCRRRLTFNSKGALNHHFHAKHALCSQLYACADTCQVEPTNFPSIYRKHLNDRHRCLDFFLTNDMKFYVLDAMADYIAMKTSGNFLCIIPPGLPSMRYMIEDKDIWNPENPETESDEYETDDEEDDEARNGGSSGNDASGGMNVEDACDEDELLANIKRRADQTRVRRDLLRRNERIDKMDVEGEGHEEQPVNEERDPQDDIDIPPRCFKMDKATGRPIPVSAINCFRYVSQGIIILAKNSVQHYCKILAGSGCTRNFSNLLSTST